MFCHWKPVTALPMENCRYDPNPLLIQRTQGEGAFDNKT